MKTLNDFYIEQNIKQFEGYTQQVDQQVDFLKKIMHQPFIKNVMEIGFNAGHSAELFLSSNNNVRVVSFDIGKHSYTKLGKEFIDKVYPNRHTLIIGNSLHSVPEFAKKNNLKFDLIFIDGGHSYDVALNDILNCKMLAHDKTIVILDDTMNNKKWMKNFNIGPNKAWKEVKEKNIIHEIESIDFSKGRGNSWGHYVFS